MATLLGEACIVAVGAGLGGSTRFLAHEAYAKWHARNPQLFSDLHPPLWGVWAVNVAASWFLGSLAAKQNPLRERTLLLGVGYCGT